MSDPQPLLHISATEARAYAIRVLAAHDVPTHHATTIAHALVSADIRGVDTHGLNRLPSYLSRIRAGVLSPTAEPTLTTPTPVVAHIDAHNAFGFVAADLGMRHACSVAETYGIALVSISHSNHFGMSAWLVQRALDAGMMSLVFTNSSPALPPHGGKEKLLGVSPIAAGAPGSGKAGQPDFILDMAPSVAARGKVYKALRRGETIPEGWALDAEGRATTDAAEALKGVMLPMGGPKGSGLAIMMDVFSGVLSGSAFAGGVTNPYDASRPADVGHFIVAMKPDLFMSGEEFRGRMGVSYERVTGGERAQGVERIFYPGEREEVVRGEREREGIPFVEAEVRALDAEAEMVGVEGLKISGKV
ncbi:hypothetical protein B0A50_01139 [Salinomyces thailandicus]|uniref:Malate/L-lactate dehydrogenase n=1 Tax=Salinomyces thailandicus TaxID=706561 RepID=A0A4U0UBS0_9PEZI|nr:hypothetical protein B0A50_01139 [Salinomyces thailandica]